MCLSEAFILSLSFFVCLLVFVFFFWSDDAEVFFSLFFPLLFALPHSSSRLPFHLSAFSALKTQQGGGDYKDWRCSDTSLPTSNWFIKDITIHSWLSVRVSFELALKSKGIVAVCEYSGQNKSVLPPHLPLLCCNFISLWLAQVNITARQLPSSDRCDPI